MRPRRAAQPSAAPAGSARSTIGAVAHRGEDPPHDRGIAADSAQRGVIIGRPASRSRFGGLAFHDPDDVEGSHVRHDPPPPGPLRAVNRRHRLGTRACALRAPGASYRRWHREDLPPYWCRAGDADPDTRSGLCAQRYRAAPRTRRTADRGADGVLHGAMAGRARPMHDITLSGGAGLRERAPTRRSVRPCGPEGPWLAGRRMNALSCMRRALGGRSGDWPASERAYCALSFVRC